MRAHFAGQQSGAGERIFQSLGVALRYARDLNDGELLQTKTLCDRIDLLAGSTQFVGRNRKIESIEGSTI